MLTELPTGPVVMSNYNRKPNLETPTRYTFQRPETSDCELKTWETARATSAAPTYFKSFSHEPSKQEYWDGGLFHNCKSEQKKKVPQSVRVRSHPHMAEIIHSDLESRVCC